VDFTVDGDGEKFLATSLLVVRKGSRLRLGGASIHTGLYLSQMRAHEWGTRTSQLLRNGIK